MKQRLAQLLLFFLLLQQKNVIAKYRRTRGFIKVNGTNFVLNGIPYYANGFNSYSLMYQAAADPSGRAKVSAVFQQAAQSKLTIVRTWAFSDGSGYMPLQYHPGSYNEQMFQGLDYVVAEARRYKIKLILSLVNNYNDYGGKQQYVNWGNDIGLHLTSADDFYTHPVVKQFYKNHVQAVVSRRNTITGTIYKNERTIMAWELMNEPRCADSSGLTIQRWVEEMASYVKSIDENHLVEVGTEGFYSSSSGGSANINPMPFDFGTDFIANNLVPAIDFATHHAYPDSWLAGSTEEEQLMFLSQWLDAHISDAQNILKKPILMTEFGKPAKNTNYTERDTLFGLVYSKTYESVQHGGPAAGCLFWHLIAQGMDNFRDDYAVILDDENSLTTSGLIAREARKLFKIRKMFHNKRKWEKWRRARATRDQSLAAHP